jgi:hypothetical protein
MVTAYEVDKTGEDKEMKPDWMFSSLDLEGDRIPQLEAAVLLSEPRFPSSSGRGPSARDTSLLHRLVRNPIKSCRMHLQFIWMRMPPLSTVDRPVRLRILSTAMKSITLGRLKTDDPRIVCMTGNSAIHQDYHNFMGILFALCEFSAWHICSQAGHTGSSILLIIVQRCKPCIVRGHGWISFYLYYSIGSLDDD